MRLFLRDYKLQHSTHKLGDLPCTDMLVIKLVAKYNTWYIILKLLGMEITNNYIDTTNKHVRLYS